MLVIAYPNQNVDTEFEFTYKLSPWIPVKELTVMTPWYEFEGPDGEFLLMVASFGAGLLVFGCIAVCMCYHCFCKPANRVEIVDDEKNLESAQNLGNI